MSDKTKPACNCTPEGDIARERHPALHQEHCAILKWWNAQNGAVISKDAQAYLDNFEIWDPEGPTARGTWARIPSAEREEVRERLRDRVHEKNAAHADRIMRDLPKKWRDVIINRFKDLP